MEAFKTIKAYKVKLRLQVMSWHFRSLRRIFLKNPDRNQEDSRMIFHETFVNISEKFAQQKCELIIDEQKKTFRFIENVSFTFLYVWRDFRKTPRRNLEQKRFELE